MLLLGKNPLVFIDLEYDPLVSIALDCFGFPLIFTSLVDNPIFFSSIGCMEYKSLSVC